MCITFGYLLGGIVVISTKNDKVQACAGPPFSFMPGVFDTWDLFCPIGFMTPTTLMVAEKGSE